MLIFLKISFSLIFKYRIYYSNLR